ncbi:hypothetical protein [uncultured Sphingomonas sp.]|uniref:hypothetical protein n=1 Tax=uncultured Sphingomonas sp. TaxID=158754 RepID=UPI0025EDD96C|nr:hypothetical protein [uncultured Sphingomonas sp.]
MPSRVKILLGGLLAGTAALVVALPALGQQGPESLLPPGFGSPPPAAPPQRGAPAPTPAPASGSGGEPRADATADTAAPVVPPTPGADEGVAVSAEPLLPTDLARLVAAEVEPPEELPPAARRSLDAVGGAPTYGTDAFGDADGRYLATLMRRLQAPIASRWAEITLRRVLLSATPAPGGVGPADWVADRAALLLRLGEADAARMLVQGVDVDNYSPRLRRVAIESALANADPAGLCPLSDGPEQVSGQPVWPMIRAMCATLSGDDATANATIGRAQPNDPIDHALAEKVIAAGGGGRRQVGIDWVAVDTLTDWRFGLASALGVMIPQSLLSAAPVWFQAWLARAPMLSPSDRVTPARIAATLGPVSSANLVDLYGQVMDDNGDVEANSPFARLRAAYRGDDDDARLAAMHGLWDASGNDDGSERDRYAASILTARAATGITPDAGQEDDVAALVASMLSAGLDRQAERWASVADAAGGSQGDRAWALLAVGATRPVVTISADRVRRFADKAGQGGAQRSALLIAALAGLGRLPDGEAQQLAADTGFTLGAPSAYADALRRAVRGGGRGTIALLVAVGMQSPRWGGVPPADFYQMIAALHAVGMNGEARMIAAEAIARA